MSGYDASKSIGGITLDADILASLDPCDIRKIARWYEAESRRLHFAASEREAKNQQRKEIERSLRKWTAERVRLSEIMITFMEDGMSRERAVNTLSRQIGEDEKKLLYILKLHIKDQNSRARDTRRITAIRLAQDGWSNEKIAEWCGCHPNTIARDLRRALQQP